MEKIKIKNKRLAKYLYWQLENDTLSIKEDIIIPYQNISVNEYRNLIKKKVG